MRTLKAFETEHETCTRTSTCIICGLPIVLGTEKVRFATPDRIRGINAHKNCWGNWADFKVIKPVDEKVKCSNNCVSHEVELSYLDFETFAWAQWNGFTRIADKNHKLSQHFESAERIGALINTAIERNAVVTVVLQNGKHFELTKENRQAEYDKLTKAICMR